MLAARAAAGAGLLARPRPGRRAQPRLTGKGAGNEFAACCVDAIARPTVTSLLACSRGLGKARPATIVLTNVSRLSITYIIHTDGRGGGGGGGRSCIGATGGRAAWHACVQTRTPASTSIEIDRSSQSPTGGVVRPRTLPSPDLTSPWVWIEGLRAPVGAPPLPAPPSTDLMTTTMMGMIGAPPGRPSDASLHRRASARGLGLHMF